jgi:hypothetical protein
VLTEAGGEREEEEGDEGHDGHDGSGVGLDAQGDYLSQPQKRRMQHQHNVLGGYDPDHAKKVRRRSERG